MITRFIFLMTFLVLASGCGLKAQTYVMTKDRVGIEKGSGNAGYLAGTPIYIEPERKTRKVYVLEFTKPVAEKDVKKIEQEVSTTTRNNVEVLAPAAQQPPVEAPHQNFNKIVIPKIDDSAPVAEVAESASISPREATTYTVVKDDTLQKISKKVYGSYSGWLKIYNANKGKIKNPNVVRAGTVLTIPAVK